MRKIFILIAISLLATMLAAQSGGIDDFLWQNEDKAEEELDNDIIRLDYATKDARKAMLYSMLLPGAGQFYADKSSITTYIFPVLEAGFITGIIVYANRGKEKAKRYEKYANGELIDFELGNGTTIQTYRYDRARQARVEEILMNLPVSDIYESSYFRLDQTNTQHFYEDIAKYPHYTFGWADWYYTFATDEAGAPQTPEWFPDPANGWIWRGNFPLWGDNTATYINHSSQEASGMKNRYIELRNEAKAEYSASRAFSFGVAFNHILSGLDAVRLSRKVNREAIVSDTGVRFNYYATLREDRITPMLGINWSF